MKGWPTLKFDQSQTQPLEAIRQKQAGVLLGVWRHLDEGGRSELTVDSLSNGRIGRTLVAKSIAESLGQPTLLASLQPFAQV